MILDRKKRGVDSFNGASHAQDTVNSCKLKSYFYKRILFALNILIAAFFYYYSIYIYSLYLNTTPTN
jgi:hypothetical protein